jgi:hypothetical protein
MDDHTRKLHEHPCPGCGFEPEVRTYIRRKGDRVRVGYECACGAVVIDGVVVDAGH